MRLLLSLLLALPLLADEKDERRREVEVTLRLIGASSNPKDANDAANLVPAELKTFLRYSHYSLIDSGYVRGAERHTLRLVLNRSILGQMRFNVEGSGAAPRIEADVKLGTNNNTTIFETSTRVKHGETTVLGSSKMAGDYALIVLLTVKVVP